MGESTLHITLHDSYKRKCKKKYVGLFLSQGEFSGTMRSNTVKKNHIVEAVSETLRYTQTNTHTQRNTNIHLLAVSSKSIS